MPALDTDNIPLQPALVAECACVVAAPMEHVRGTAVHYNQLRLALRRPANLPLSADDVVGGRAGTVGAGLPGDVDPAHQVN